MYAHFEPTARFKNKGNGARENKRSYPLRMSTATEIKVDDTDLSLVDERWRGGTLLLPPHKFSVFTFHPHARALGTLLRFSVRLPHGRKLMLHHFRPHREREWHDHPWDFRTFVLWGGYTDESLQADGQIVVDTLRAGSYRLRVAEHAHRTYSQRGALTLVLTTRPRKPWCHSGEDITTPRADWTCQE